MLDSIIRKRRAHPRRYPTMSHEPIFLKAPAERMIELLMGNRTGNLIWFRWEGSCQMKVSCKSLCCRDIGKGEAEGPRHPLPVHHQHFLKVYLIYLVIFNRLSPFW